MSYNERSCVLCTASNIANEFHFILECSATSITRKEYLHCRYYIRPNVFKFYVIMSSSIVHTLNKLCMFIFNFLKKLSVLLNTMKRIICMYIFSFFLSHDYFVPIPLILFLFKCIFIICSSCPYARWL